MSSRAAIAALYLAALIAASAYAQTSPIPELAPPPPTPVPATPAPAQGSPAPARDDSYRLGPEDVLDISVGEEDGLKKETGVRPGGALSVSPIRGGQAAGRPGSEGGGGVGQPLVPHN